MNSAELQARLRARFPSENERHEWKGWRGLKHNVSGNKGEDLICYVSALANMDGGCIVIGATDGSLAPTGVSEPADYTPENLPHRLLGRCAHLPSLGLHVETLPASIVGVSRRRAFIKSLLQDLARRQEIENIGGATKAARWALVRP